MRADLSVAGAAVLLAAAVATAGEDPAPAAAALHPDVLVVTVDTLRPDALGWVAGVNATPAIDRLANEGFAFPAAVTPVPLTLPAHVSLFTGLIPPHHGVRDNGQTLGDAPTTLAETLRARGYSTAAFVSGYPLERVFGLDRGFSHYDDAFTEGREGWLERRALDTTAAALSWLATAPRPWFAWVHYYDPHDPYDPPRAFWAPGPRGAYLGEVAYTDFAIHRLLAGLPAAAKPGRLIVFAADHGEALGQHRELRHGYFIYDATVTVPLVFHFPGRIRAAQSPAPARLVDVAPTILDLLDLPPLAEVDGSSLVPLFDGRRHEVASAYVETYLPWVFYGWSPLKGLRSAQWKLVVAPRPELYDLAEDPAEEHNLASEQPELTRRLERELTAMTAGRSVPAAATTLDEKELAGLAALGYVSLGTPPGEPPPDLPDPKDRVDLRDRLHEAEEALRRGDFTAAVAAFDRVLSEEPDNRCAVLRSGIALLKAGDPAAAVPRLERAVSLDPDRAEAHFALADALMRLQQPARAAVHWREVLRLQPRRSEARFNLGSALLAAGQPEAAVEALRRAVADRPGEPAWAAALARAEREAQGIEAPAANPQGETRGEDPPPGGTPFDPSGTWTSDLGDLSLVLAGDALSFSYTAVFGPAAHVCDGAGVAGLDGEGRWVWKDDAGTVEILAGQDGLRMRVADGVPSFCGAGWDGDAFPLSSHTLPVPCTVTAETSHFHVVDPLAPERRRGYVVRADRVEIVPTRNLDLEGFVLARYVGPRSTTAGLIRRDDLDCPAQ